MDVEARALYTYSASGIIHEWGNGRQWVTASGHLHILCTHSPTSSGWLEDNLGAQIRLANEVKASAG